MHFFHKNTKLLLGTSSSADVKGLKLKSALIPMPDVGLGDEPSLSFNRCILNFARIFGGVESFKNCKMEKADLQLADFRGSVFQGCNLQNADFRSAQLIRVLFKDCDLRHANFDDAVMNSCAMVNCLVTPTAQITKRRELSVVRCITSESTGVVLSSDGETLRWESGSALDWSTDEPNIYVRTEPEARLDHTSFISQVINKRNISASFDGRIVRIRDVEGSIETFARLSSLVSEEEVGCATADARFDFAALVRIGVLPSSVA